ncbi:hypothetical protein [Butyricicoccus pullicaecorum]|uniref:Thil AANH domain-containing protein n=1 Tax=Butyricicoccus pullicaecorum 1.2 TaxID=1203606 RepID=R8VZE0_9FIRM|nr:hypothetical protein [Butyricicoccus pullicaecorum]EOQ37933.1 hypothetical protein HMPREF1526_00961 [Butyricicoccus pullicaecorum 1.2]SKA60690.1 Thiamine biosynthesis protein (ThiI) [Butyricicoccus pullicaecorum DSM 23266]
MAELERNSHVENSILLMLSGGRDSFLSACRLIEQGKRVYMITYDNKCMSNAKGAQEVAERIIQRYGPEKAVFVGIQSVAAHLYRLQKNYLYQTLQESSQKYPNLRPAQMPCLACHTGMYIESIAYCKAHNIPAIAEGAREIQGFFVELPEMVERYEKLAKDYDITIELPVYKLKDDWERKLELADRGFVPKTFEPQCWLGCPLGENLNEEERRSLAAYYDAEMEPKLEKLIDARIAAMKHEETMITEDEL